MQERDEVWLYEHGDMLKTFGGDAAARAWLRTNDPNGVATKYKLGPVRPAGGADKYGVPVASE